MSVEIRISIFTPKIIKTEVYHASPGDQGTEYIKYNWRKNIFCPGQVFLVWSIDN
jgi:hypothetical protein